MSYCLKQTKKKKNQQTSSYQTHHLLVLTTAVVWYQFQIYRHVILGHEMYSQGTQTSKYARWQERNKQISENKLIWSQSAVQFYQTVSIIVYNLCCYSVQSPPPPFASFCLNGTIYCDSSKSLNCRTTMFELPHDNAETPFHLCWAARQQTTFHSFCQIMHLPPSVSLLAWTFTFLHSCPPLMPLCAGSYHFFASSILHWCCALCDFGGGSGGAGGWVVVEQICEVHLATNWWHQLTPIFVQFRVAFPWHPFPLPSCVRFTSQCFLATTPPSSSSLHFTTPLPSELLLPCMQLLNYTV